MSYKFNLPTVIRKIKEHRANIVGLQFPDGLKTYAVRLARKLEKKLDVTVLISADPCYGACDISDTKMENMVDLIIHYGHTPLPIDYKVPVIFIEAYADINIKEALESSIRLLTGYRRIGVATTTQHLHLLDEMVKFLEEKGKEVLVGSGDITRKGQVLGCNFSSVKGLNVDAYLFVGSGDFHPLGIRLFTNKPVIVADPYTGGARDIEKFADKILRIRFAQITKAKDAKKWGVIISSKRGQNRLPLALNLKRKLEEEGKEAFLFVLENVTPELLTPFREVDAFVVSACPRIAIDDYQIYKKPLITPPELEIVLKKRKWEDYTLDEILF